MTSSRIPGSSAEALAAAVAATPRAALEAALDIMPVPALLIEPGTGRVTFANRAADRLAGGEFPKGGAAQDYDRLYFCTDADGARIPADAMPGVRASRGESLDGFMMDWHLPDGVHSLLISSATVPATADEPGVVVVVFEDVTALRRAEAEARAAADARERSLAGERRARERIERAERRAAFLAEASTVLTGSLELEETLRRVTRIAVPAKADWATVDWLGRRGRIERRAIAHRDPEHERLGHEIARRWPNHIDDPEGTAVVMRTGQPLLLEQITDEVLRGASRDAEHLATLRTLGLRSAIIVPLKVRARVVGAMTFVVAETGRTYGQEDLDLAVELARRASVAIEHAEVHRERSDIARTLQRSLLPASLPEIPGFEVAARYSAAGEALEVGGDFYDVFETPDGGWALAVGDVCGKGPEAAAVTSLARHTLRAVSSLERHPAAALELLNRAVLHDGGGRFLTTVHAGLDLGGGVPGLTVAVAGHPPPLVCQANGEVHEIHARGGLVGVRDDARFEAARVELAPGDAAVLYTDGVLEAGAPRRLLEPQDLAQVLSTVAGRPAAEIAQTLERAALRQAEGAPRDDIAILVLRRLP